MGTNEDLDVWKSSINFVEEIYILTKDFPTDEKYGLTNQLRRAAVSIPSNIAEGAARRSDKEFMQFLYISLGSIAEIDTQLIISDNLGYLESSELRSDLLVIKTKLLNYISYRKKLQKK
jgi:four helix bundle protein